MLEGGLRQAISYNTHKRDILTHQVAMRTNIDIDEKLMRKAMRRSGTSTKKATVEVALQLLVETLSQTSVRRLRGKVKWEGDLNQSGLGRIRE